MTVVHDLRIETIIVGERLRPLVEETVGELKKSMAEIGLINPIMIARPNGTIPKLVSGAHRLEAARRLGWETISCMEYAGGSEDQCRLAEIDENLARGDLSPAERAIHIRARKEIYERLHPETVHGLAGKNRPKSQSRKFYDSENANENNRFTAEVAELTGRSESAVQKESHRGKTLGEAALTRVARTSLDKGDELDALAKLAPEKRDALIDRAAAGEKVSAKTAVKQDQRKCREEILGVQQRALPDKKYGVILADPEWRFEPYSRETGMDRAADNHYPTSETDVIASRPVASIAADDCVLFLWATAPMLPQALYVMEAWGFAELPSPRADLLLGLLGQAYDDFLKVAGLPDDAIYPDHWTRQASDLFEPAKGSSKCGRYVSNFVWGKDRIGTGYWNRNKHEHLLIGVRGNVPAPAMGTQWDSLLEAAVGAHSEKPERFYELIEAYFPSLPKIELNARKRRAGWDAWGLEVPAATEFVLDEIHEVTAEFAAAHPFNPESEAPKSRPEAERKPSAHLTTLATEKSLDHASVETDASGANEAPQLSTNIMEGDAEAEPSTQNRFVGKGEAGEGTYPNSPASASNVIPLPEEIPAFAIDAPKNPDPGIEEIPDYLLRVELTKKELAMLNRLSLEDADRDEQDFIKLTRKHPEAATVATRNRLAEIAKAQGITTEQSL